MFRIGEYEVLRKIAAGGMGSVFVARRVGPAGFSKIVAIKQLHPHFEPTDEVVERFVWEARIGSELAHPNIVEVLDLARDDEGYHIVMEHVHGLDLHRLLNAQPERKLSERHATLIAREVLSGLEAAHSYRSRDGVSRPVVHRDLKLRNVIISGAGEVKILDFGVARIGGAPLSRVPGLRGTCSYMSPEQAHSGETDARTDLYAVGIILAEMLTGRRLNPGRSDEEALHHARSGLLDQLDRRRPMLPAALAPILRQSLQPTPDDRFADAAAFRAALDRHLDRVGRPKREELSALVREHLKPLPEADGARDARVTLAGDSTTAPPGATGDPRKKLGSPDGRRRPRARAVLLAGLLVGLAGAALVVGSHTLSTDRAGARPDLALDRYPIRDAPAADAEAASDAPANAPRPSDAAVSPRGDPGPDSRAEPPRPRRRSGVLLLNSLPTWSRVTIDGRKRGTTPLRVRLPVGRHRVVLHPAQKGKPMAFWVRVVANKTIRRIVRIPD